MKEKLKERLDRMDQSYVTALTLCEILEVLEEILEILEEKRDGPRVKLPATPIKDIKISSKKGKK